MTPSKCAKGDTEIKEVSTVTGGTGKAVNVIKKGQIATLLVCLKGSTVSLLPGQKYQI